MQIVNLDKDEVLEKAKATFPNKYIEMDETDLFLADIESGKIHIEGIDHDVYVSTHYAYEDHLVNGNKTRYKIPLMIFTLKEDPYDVVYDSYGKCYVAYKEQDDITFVLYEDFQDVLKTIVTKIDD